MAKLENELEIIESGFQFPINQNDADDLADEMDGVYMSFDRVKVPTGGSVAFEVPGDDPDSPDSVKELVGVIIDHYPTQTYYENPLEGSGESTPPDCQSHDGKIGIGNPGGSCALCPFNQWGSGRGGKGKACKTKRRLFLLPEGQGLPLELVLPPTSLKNFNNFITKRIVGKGRRTHGVITKITLKKCKNNAGTDYSEAQFSVVRDLTAQEQVQSKIYSSDMKEFTRRRSDEVEDTAPMEEVEENFA